jgi:hypothetical protein
VNTKNAITRSKPYKAGAIATLLARVQRVEIEERALRATSLRLAHGPALVDGLDDLEGKVHPRHFFDGGALVVLAAPAEHGPGDLDLGRRSFSCLGR